MDNDTRIEAWNELLQNLSACAVKKYQTSVEYHYWKQRMEQINEFLTSNLTADQKVFVEEILFEIGMAEERQQQILYKQGMMDGIWILKQMGILV